MSTEYSNPTLHQMALYYFVNNSDTEPRAQELAQEFVAL